MQGSPPQVNVAPTAPTASASFSGPAQPQSAPYGAPPSQPQQYGAPPSQPQPYGGPSSQPQQYGAPPSQYGAPPSQPQQYGDPPPQQKSGMSGLFGLFDGQKYPPPKAYPSDISGFAPGQPLASPSEDDDLGCCGNCCVSCMSGCLACWASGFILQTQMCSCCLPGAATTSDNQVHPSQQSWTSPPPVHPGMQEGGVAFDKGGDLNQRPQVPSPSRPPTGGGRLMRFTTWLQSIKAGVPPSEASTLHKPEAPALASQTGPARAAGVQPLQPQPYSTPSVVSQQTPAPWGTPQPQPLPASAPQQASSNPAITFVATAPSQPPPNMIAPVVAIQTVAVPAAPLAVAANVPQANTLPVLPGFRKPTAS